ncbi:MAG TPA: arylsulfatase [Gemmataceae bacterium]|nr:arylsulfatase [Gemmataceae bacterium]
MFRCVCLALLAVILAGPAAAAPPNVVLVITDDQGYGDLGCHGNPILKTPHIDRLAKESGECTHFYVCPVCAPTRSALLTGRYNYRTQAIDTFAGRALMRPDEVTLSHMLGAAGYRCGLFGKWHLGDNYPLRPQDRGFHEVLMLRGGGIAQPSDPPGSSYYKPILEHNGVLESYDRYCSDLFTDATIDFIGRTKDRPFFAYLAFNCPHLPMQAPEAETVPYTKLDLTPAAFPKIGRPYNVRAMKPEDLAKAYGMIANIDANLGRLFTKLDEWKLTDNTIVIFMTDNGPGPARWVSGLRAAKGSVYEGGIRVPFFIRWPAGGLGGGRTVDPACAHIDAVPTLLSACGLTPPGDGKIDGVNLLPLLRGEVNGLPERTLFVQWHRGDVPEKYRAFAARAPRYKLVQATGAQAGAAPNLHKLELFDIPADPYEEHDLAAEKPEVVARLKRQYETWFDDVGKAHGYVPVRIKLGTPHENPTRLTRQDWRGPRALDWTKPNSLGHWEVTVARDGTFDVTLRFPPAAEDRKAAFRLGRATAENALPANVETVTFRRLQLTTGDARLEAWAELGGTAVGPMDVTVKRLE